MTSTSQSVLAIDFGTRRIGVAIGQTFIGTSTALEPIPAKDGKPDWSFFDSLIAEWQPDLLVVGVPLNMDGTVSEMSRRARKFANRLQDRFQKPCYLVDERLSTSEAKEIHFDRGGGSNFRKESVDGLAAQIIFDRFIHSEERIPSHTRLEDLYDLGHPQR
jgi:putative Holliday junction resolvase